MISSFQEVDVHGMNKVQAFTAIDAVLRRANGSVYTVRVIHGYHIGTVLRDSIRKHYRDHPKVKRIELGLNPGETDLILRELLCSTFLRYPSILSCLRSRIKTNY